jgi:hypothetical protein
MADTPFGTNPDSYGARLRAKGVQIDAGHAKSTRKGTPSSNAQYNGWERGVVGEHRPGETFMPYLNAHGDAIRNKAHSEGKYDKAKQALSALRTSA